MTVAESPYGAYRSPWEAPMATIQKTIVTTEVGPREMTAGVAYVHAIELEDDEKLEVGQRVEIRDGGGNFHAAVVDERVGPRWRLRIQP